MKEDADCMSPLGPPKTHEEKAGREAHTVDRVSLHILCVNALIIRKSIDGWLG